MEGGGGGIFLDSNSEPSAGGGVGVGTNLLALGFFPLDSTFSEFETLHFCGYGLGFSYPCPFLTFIRVFPGYIVDFNSD